MAIRETEREPCEHIEGERCRQARDDPRRLHEELPQEASREERDEGAVIVQYVVRDVLQGLLREVGYVPTT